MSPEQTPHLLFPTLSRSLWIFSVQVASRPRWGGQLPRGHLGSLVDPALCHQGKYGRGATTAWWHEKRLPRGRRGAPSWAVPPGDFSSRMASKRKYCFGGLPRDLCCIFKYQRDFFCSHSAFQNCSLSPHFSLVKRNKQCFWPWEGESLQFVGVPLAML